MSIGDRFVSGQGIKFGPGSGDEAESGALITERQRTRVAGFVDRAGALPHIEVVTGGRASEGAGLFYEPTVIAGHGRTTRASAARFLGRSCP